MWLQHFLGMYVQQTNFTPCWIGKMRHGPRYLEPCDFDKMPFHLHPVKKIYPQKSPFPASARKTPPAKQVRAFQASTLVGLLGHLDRSNYLLAWRCCRQSVTGRGKPNGCCSKGICISKPRPPPFLLLNLLAAWILPTCLHDGKGVCVRGPLGRSLSPQKENMRAGSRLNLPCLPAWVLTRRIGEG